MAQQAYSFLNVNATIIGPGGAISIGSDAGVAEEGITIEPSDGKNTMTTGAGGEIMHSLAAVKTAKYTVRLMKTSPTNAALQALYNFQSQSSALWGQNTILVSDTIRGDVCSGQACAFTKQPSITYSKVGAMNEWTFDVGAHDQILGAGVPDVNV